MWVHRYLLKWSTSSDETGRCMVEGSVSSMCYSISLRSLMGSTYSESIPVVAASI